MYKLQWPSSPKPGAFAYVGKEKSIVCTEDNILEGEEEHPLNNKTYSLCFHLNWTCVYSTTVPLEIPGQCSEATSAQ